MRTILVTLSGTHGSGKSTNAGRVYYLLNKSGKRFSYIRHQDLLDPFGFIVRRMARVLRLDVNYLEGSTPVRLLWSLYFILIYYPLLAGGIGIRRRLGYNVVTDRYLYDLIVGFWGVQKRVPIENLLVWVLPHPDISFVFDADEKRILSDRPEHTAEFIRNEKRIYNSLAAQFHLTTISTSESKQIVWQRVVTAIEKCMNGVSANTQAKEQVNN
jgi:thymidylate kinase